jgi:pyruvate dehydrogenase E2 component (dihydrolipoamide acetyltransferase)
MNGVRKATVKAMSKSHTEIAAFTGMKNMDITPVYDLRAQLKGFAEKKGIKLTYLAFIVKAAALALKDMPNVNVRGDFENKQILQIHNINIGIAVDTPEGLMVPVIKGAYAMSIFEIATKISELAKKARDRKLTLPEMRDATFTISNFGSVGLDYATPIINSPEASILGIGTMTKTPVFKNDAVVARYIMPFSITSDHRILDGADAARFLNKMQEYLDQPLSLVV